MAGLTVVSQSHHSSQYPPASCQFENIPSQSTILSKPESEMLLSRAMERMTMMLKGEGNPESRMDLDYAEKWANFIISEPPTSPSIHELRSTFTIPISETLHEDRENVIYQRVMSLRPDGEYEMVDIKEIASFVRSIYSGPSPFTPDSPIDQGPSRPIELVQDSCVLMLLVLDEILDLFGNEIFDLEDEVTDKIRTQWTSKMKAEDESGDLSNSHSRDLLSSLLLQHDGIVALHCLLSVFVE